MKALGFQRLGCKHVPLEVRCYYLSPLNASYWVPPGVAIGRDVIPPAKLHPRPSISLELCKTAVGQGPGITGAEQGGRKGYVWL